MASRLTESPTFGSEDAIDSDSKPAKSLWKSLAMSLFLCLGTVFLFVALPVGLVVSDAVVYVLWAVTAVGIVTTTVVLCKTRLLKESQLCSSCKVCELGSSSNASPREAPPPLVVQSEASVEALSLPSTSPAVDIHRKCSNTCFENPAFESGTKPASMNDASEIPARRTAEEGEEIFEAIPERKASVRHGKSLKIVRNKFKSTLKRFVKQK